MIEQLKQFDMATYTLKVNERTNAGKALLNYLLSLGVIVEDSTPEYDPEMVAKVRRGREAIAKGECVTIKASEIWN